MKIQYFIFLKQHPLHTQSQPQAKNYEYIWGTFCPNNIKIVEFKVIFTEYDIVHMTNLCCFPLAITLLVKCQVWYLLHKISCASCPQSSSGNKYGRKPGGPGSPRIRPLKGRWWTRCIHSCHTDMQYSNFYGPLNTLWRHMNHCWWPNVHCCYKQTNVSSVCKPDESRTCHWQQHDRHWLVSKAHEPAYHHSQTNDSRTPHCHRTESKQQATEPRCSDTLKKWLNCSIQQQNNYFISSDVTLHR